MKRFMTLLLLSTLIFTLSGCKEQDSESAAPSEVVEGTGAQLQTVVIPSEESGADNTADEGFKQELEIVSAEGNTFYFPEQDLSAWPKEKEIDPMVETVMAPETYTQFTRSLREEDLIVSGRAQGIREGYNDGELKYTLTTFSIEKVFHGTAPESNTIRVRENYLPVCTEEKSYIHYSGEGYTLLKNDQLTLLFLKYNPYSQNYTSFYYQLPLPEDYLDYSEASLTELLDYYRNKPEMRKTVVQSTTPLRIENPDGTYTEEYFYIEPDQPVIENTNEEMLALMEDHILVQLSTRLKIKIWPARHIRYTGDQNILNNTGIVAFWQQ